MLTLCRKKDTKSVIGPEGLKHTLQVLDDNGHSGVPVVCIGGLNASNVFQVMFRGSPQGNPVDGVAVVSAIMAAENPQAASQHLLDLVVTSDKLNRSAEPRSGRSSIETKEHILDLVPQVIKTVHETKPLSHNMTNLVFKPRTASYSSMRFTDKLTGCPKFCGQCRSVCWRFAHHG